MFIFQPNRIPRPFRPVIDVGLYSINHLILLKKKPDNIPKQKNIPILMYIDIVL